MKKVTTFSFMIPLLMFLEFFSVVTNAYGSESSVGGSHITFEKGTDPNSGVLDPETLKPADPGEIAKTEGPLRIDFAPQLTFAATEISKTDLKSSAHAQLFHNGTGARGNFVQVSDYRAKETGWRLLVRQETQFRSQSADTLLKGAYISFDQAWTNSTSVSKAPKVSKEVINMSNIGETYLLAEAAANQGGGTWSIVFGASKDNAFNQPNTLFPLVDAEGNQVTDAEFENQQVYINQGVTLTIPHTEQLKPGNYSTVLTWIISELP